jgi:exoribonuclease R
MAAAKLMLEGGVGILRTVPPASEGSLARLRRAAGALGVDWPAGLSYPDFIHGLDPAQPTHAALLHEATGVLRGAGYVAFDGPPPEQPGHSAIAAPYAHVTAPLRRLADRYALEVCAALCAGTAIPDWARAGLPELPEAMQAADRRAGSLERAVVDLVEAVVLEPCVGRTYDAVVVDDGRVQIADPAVVAPCDGDPPVGERIRVRLAEADPDSRRVRFEPL